MDTPLKDLLVIETASVLAGPAVGMFFAELGARVIKLENSRAGGDATRKWKLPKEDSHAPISAYFSSVNHGKEHRMVDLTDPLFRGEFDALVTKADILITNHLTADAEKLGLQRERLQALNPRMIHGHIRGYADDPSRPAYDVVLQAETGYISMTGSDSQNPAKLPVAMIDILAAHQLKEGLLLALLQRKDSGRGAYVDVSLEEAALAGLVNQATNWLMVAHTAQPLGTLHPNIAPYGEVFTTGDEKRLVLAVGSNDQFKALCHVLDIDDLVHDQHFSSNPKRVTNRNVLAQLLGQPMALRERNELLDAFKEAQVPAGAVLSIDEALSSPLAKRMLLEQEIDGKKTLRLRGNAFHLQPH